MPRPKYTHDCVRTIAFTCPCDSEGNSDDATLRHSLIRRLFHVDESGEWQEACGLDATDICELEQEVI